MGDPDSPIDRKISPRVSDILYVRFQVRNLDQQRKFLKDFGLDIEEAKEFLLARGTDPRRYVYVAQEGPDRLVEIGFEVESLEMLECIAAIDKVPVEPLELPGRGVGIKLNDPDGNQIRVVHGLAKQEQKEPPHRPPVNTGCSKQRLGNSVCFEAIESRVKRLGHCFLCVKDLEASQRWYRERLGLLISTEVVDYEDAKKLLGVALRCNCEDNYVDFHSLFLLGNGRSELGHVAFEISDIDSLLIGHDYLLDEGQQHEKGVGRHKISSNVFDYWRDPSGVVFECITDGDLLNESDGLNVCSKEDLLSSHWGCGVPYRDKVG